MKKRRTGRRIMLLAASLLVICLLLEGIVRVLFPYYDPARQIVFHVNPDGVPLGPIDRVVRQRTPKGDYDLQVVFNRFGFRDQKDLSASTDTDWFALGDSFSMGWGVEEARRFSDLVAARLGRRVFNIAIPTDIRGYEALLAYARRNGARVRNLIIAVCMENDLHDYDLSDSNAHPAPPESGGRMRAYLRSHSALYLLLADRLQSIHPIRRLLERLGVARAVDSDELMNRNRYDEATLNRAAELLARVAAESDRPLVLIIPSRALWLGNNRDTEVRVHDFFVSEVKRRGLEVVDMRPEFEAAGDPLRFYFATDPHWNEEGHRVAAQRLADRIESGPLPAGR